MVLSFPPDVYMVDIGETKQGDALGALRLMQGELLDTMRRELELEIAYVNEKTQLRRPYFHQRRMYWCGWSGVHLLERLFKEWFSPTAAERGLPMRLKDVYWLCPEEDRVTCLGEIARVWQALWSDESIERCPSTYSTFCRDTVFLPPYGSSEEVKVLFVRPFCIDVERARAAKRLDRALLTPRQIPRTLIMNGVRFCWEDYVGNNPLPAPTLGTLSHRERAAFVLCQLMMGSRFKGIAMTNTITRLEPNMITLKGLSKSKDPTKKVKRFVNVSLAQEVRRTDTERMTLLHDVFLTCRAATVRIWKERNVLDEGEVLAACNVMRKEIKAYMNLVFPGLLIKGEGTHLLRKIYLQLAFETYGQNMKETGFAAQMFAHEGYNTSLHYTSVIII